MKRKIICIVLVVLFLLCACTQETLQQENNLISESIQEEQTIHDISEDKEGGSITQDDTVISEDTLTYELETFLPENPIGEMYYWVFLQNGRRIAKQKDVQKINDRLHELGLDSSVGFHIITIEEYITPEVLTQVYEDLDGQMDFVSIGSALCGFYMDEWQEHFIELSDELKSGELQTFYTTVPEIVWDANKIAGGIYSFSNSTEIYVKGYTFEAEILEEYGEEALLKFHESNGIENEEAWKELYEIKDKSIITWDLLSNQRYLCIEENPYERMTLSKMTDQFEKYYFSFFTDDIRFNLETEEFEWLIESDTYIGVKDKVEELYSKGYLGAKYCYWDEKNHIGGVFLTGGNSNTATIQDMKISGGNEWNALFVPAWKESRISRYETNQSYMYSFVSNKAHEGWEKVLNLVGADEQIVEILNQSAGTVTISHVIYEERMVGIIPDIENQYEMIKQVYEEANPNPIGDFIFNPLPIQEEWKEYNEKMYGFDTISFQKEPKGDGYNYPVFEAMDTVWETYQSRKEEAHIDLVLEEVNRQYTEWKKAKSGIG